MFKIRVLDTVIEIDNTYSYIYEYCRDWLAEDGAVPAFRARVTGGEISCYMSSCGYKTRPEIVERVLMCKKIAWELPRADMFLLHGAVIDYEGTGIVFSAKRGVGKTTHVELWERVYGGSVKLINGDKPFITKRGGEYLACGTPWRGKEGRGDGSCVAVRKLCFIERAQSPSVKKLSAEEAWEYMSVQTIFPKDSALAGRFAEMAADFLRSVDVYVAYVNMGEESAVCVRKEIMR